MKKLILFLTIVLSMSLNAQTLTTSTIAMPNTYVNVPTNYNLWKLTSKDTVITISNVTANRYRDYRVTYTLTGANSVVRVDNQEFKQWIE